MENDENLSTIRILIELPKEENNVTANDEKSECLREARKDALNTVNLVLHEIESSEKFTDSLKKSNKNDPHLKHILDQTHKLFNEAKQVIQKCTENNLNKNTEGTKNNINFLS